MAVMKGIVTRFFIEPKLQRIDNNELYVWSIFYRLVYRYNYLIKILDKLYILI